MIITYCRVLFVDFVAVCNKLMLIKVKSKSVKNNKRNTCHHFTHKHTHLFKFNLFEQIKHVI